VSPPPNSFGQSLALRFCRAGETNAMALGEEVRPSWERGMLRLPDRSAAWNSTGSRTSTTLIGFALELVRPAWRGVWGGSWASCVRHLWSRL